MENNQNKVPASSKDQSFVEDMAKNLFDNYIVPKSTNLMHDFFSGFLTMMSDTAQAGIDNSFKKLGWNGVTKSNVNGNTAYNKMYTVSSSSSNNKVTVNSVQNTLESSATDMKLIFVKEEAQAKQLLDLIKQHWEKYDHKISIGNVYNLLDPPIPTTNHTVFKWGWKNIDQIGYIRIFNNDYGEEHKMDYLMQFPKPVNIETI